MVPHLSTSGSLDDLAVFDGSTNLISDIVRVCLLAGHDIGWDERLVGALALAAEWRVLTPNDQEMEATFQSILKDIETSQYGFEIWNRFINKARNLIINPPKKPKEALYLLDALEMITRAASKEARLLNEITSLREKALEIIQFRNVIENIAGQGQSNDLEGNG